MALGTKLLCTLSLLSLNSQNERKRPMTTCPRAPQGIYPGLLGGFDLQTELGAFPFGFFDPSEMISLSLPY